MERCDQIKMWFVKDFADGWISFDNEVDATRHVDTTGAVMLVGVYPSERSPNASEAFARWLEDGPKLAKAAGCYVGIKVSPLPADNGRAE